MVKAALERWLLACMLVACPMIAAQLSTAPAHAFPATPCTRYNPGGGVNFADPAWYQDNSCMLGNIHMFEAGKGLALSQDGGKTCHTLLQNETETVHSGPPLRAPDPSAYLEGCEEAKQLLISERLAS